MESPIPLQNIYYLLCYAWNRLDERDVVEVGSIDSTELVDLFAKVLIGGTRHLIRRGFDRGYLAFAEESRTVRGKVAFAASVKRNLFRQARAHCEFDELDHNVLHNRILKTTLLLLSKTEELAKDHKEGAQDMLRWLSRVEPVPLSPQVFRRVQLHRNNHYYGFLLNVCEMIYGHLLVDEQTGRARFRDFLQDEHRMRLLFQDFVRNFYELEQAAFRVASPRIRWQAEFEGEEAETYLPGMQTDVCLAGKKTPRNIILDCKYYKEALVTHHKQMLHSEHLYQIFAYLKNKEVEPGWEECEGILLYPAVRRSLDLRYKIQGHPVRIATINLNQDWQQIERDMLGIIGL
jgi:5-methylcytosine-specific restriction enzyme subunit McrC